MDDSIKTILFNKLDSLFAQIKQGRINNDAVTIEDSALSRSIFYSFRDIEDNTKEKIKDFYVKEVINCCPVAINKYAVSIAYLSNKQVGTPAIRAIVTLIATVENENVFFSIPLNYQTQHWKKKTIGNITYHYERGINESVSHIFNAKNTLIATRLGLAPEKFDFYICNNYQEILALLGYMYDFESNGKARSGLGVAGHTIFSMMGSEDFSHDVFHFYSAKIRTNSRNTAAEEGLAYSWGNAYYTDPNRNMITQGTLVKELKRYFIKHPDVRPLTLFHDNLKIFNAYATELSVKSVISGLICVEIYRQKGITAIKQLLNCGKGDENYLREVDALIQINESNFDAKVRHLIENN